MNGTQPAGERAPSRRRFLAGLIGVMAAPLVVRAESIMPVKAPKLIHPQMVLGIDEGVDGVTIVRAIFPGDVRGAMQVVEIATLPAGTKIVQSAKAIVDEYAKAHLDAMNFGLGYIAMTMHPSAEVEFNRWRDDRWMPPVQANASPRRCAGSIV